MAAMKTATKNEKDIFFMGYSYGEGSMTLP